MHVGGEILATGGIREAYEHGRGAVTVRGRAFVEGAETDAASAGSSGRAAGGRQASVRGGKEKALKPSVVITEMPYQTNKAEFVASVAQLVEEQKLTGAPVPLPIYCYLRHLEKFEIRNYNLFILCLFPKSTVQRVS